MNGDNGQKRKIKWKNNKNRKTEKVVNNGLHKYKNME